MTMHPHQSIEPKPLIQHPPKTHKFDIDEKVYAYNYGKQTPLITEFVIQGVMNTQEGIMYLWDKTAWMKEEFIFKTRKEAYRRLIQTAEIEMNQEDK